jgi:hypothetical protein
MTKSEMKQEIDRLRLENEALTRFVEFWKRQVNRLSNLKQIEDRRVPQWPPQYPVKQ